MIGFESPSPLLPEILALHARWRGDKEAVCCEGQRLNWRQFVAGHHRFGNALLDQGITPGDRVGIVMSNGIPMLQAMFGSLSAGATVVPINLSISDEALLAMLVDADIMALVVTDDQRSRIEPLEGSLPAGLRLKISESGDGEAWQALEALASGQPESQPAVAIDPDSAINIIYSSGTTGRPKGIVHSHRGRRDWAYDLAIALRYHGAARTLLTIGLYSNISWVGMLCTLLAGGSIVVHRQFDAADFIETVAAEKITHTAMVPIQFQRVIETLEQRGGDVNSMQAMMSCGSPLHEDLKRAIFEYFHCGVIELYGLTEGIITTLDPEDAVGRWRSVGKPLVGTDIRIVGDDGKPVSPGQSGEIVSRGRISMPGYWQREDATREAEWRDAEGRQWLRSGDIGQLDDQGFLYIVDRKKDMILSGGQNVYPQDIEAVLAQHPAVNDVAVIGAPSKRWGETPLVLMVAEPGAEVDTGLIRDWANLRLGKQQRVADVVLVDDLPRNPNGKILKRELRKTYAAMSYD